MKLIIEIPNESTRQQMNEIKECINDMLSVNDIIGVMNGNVIQWKLSKRNGELLIKIRSDWKEPKHEMGTDEESLLEYDRLNKVARILPVITGDLDTDSLLEDERIAQENQ